MSKQLREFQARKTALVKEARALTDVVASEDRDMSDDEVTAFDALRARISAHEGSQTLRILDGQQGLGVGGGLVQCGTGGLQVQFHQLFHATEGLLAQSDSGVQIGLGGGGELVGIDPGEQSFCGKRMPVDPALLHCSIVASIEGAPGIASGHAAMQHGLDRKL